MAILLKDRKLPIKLAEQPLIDAVFEMRFLSSVPASDILPGFLFGKLPGEKKIESLPVAQVPKPLRDSDPNLQFSPITRLRWSDYVISIGDRSISIGCNYPYPGWSNFKPAIKRITGLLKEINIFQSISRYSMKYVDLILSTNVEHQISLIDMDISVAGHKIKNQEFQLRVELITDNFVNIIQIIPSASAMLLNGEKRCGIIIDVDTIYNINDLNIEEVFNGSFDTELEDIHTMNKRMFFDCLNEETIKSLGPIYD